MNVFNYNYSIYNYLEPSNKFKKMIIRKKTITYERKKKIKPNPISKGNHIYLWRENMIV